MSTTQPAITWLNMSGDVTISWTPENEQAMLALVEEKMKAGFSFFIVKPRLLGLGKKKVKATSMADVRAAGSVVVEDSFITGLATKLHDKEVESVVQKGAAQLTKPHSSEKEVVRRAASAREVLANQTVALRPVVGG